MSTVFVTIGFPASGKSTWCQNYFRPHEIVCTDTIRGQISGNELDQSINKEAWNVAYALVKAKLYTLQAYIVVDATQARRKNRTSFVRHVRSHMSNGSLVYGVIFTPKVETSIARDRNREGAVGADVIKRMAHSLKSAPPALDEGFDGFYIVDNDMSLKVEGEPWTSANE